MMYYMKSFLSILDSQIYLLFLLAVTVASLRLNLKLNNLFLNNEFAKNCI